MATTTLRASGSPLHNVELPNSPREAREDQPNGFILETGRRIPSTPRMRCEGCRQLLTLENALVAWDTDYKAESEFLQPTLLCKLTPGGRTVGAAVTVWIPAKRPPPQHRCP